MNNKNKRRAIEDGGPAFASADDAPREKKKKKKKNQIDSHCTCVRYNMRAKRIRFARRTNLRRFRQIVTCTFGILDETRSRSDLFSASARRFIASLLPPPPSSHRTRVYVLFKFPSSEKMARDPFLSVFWSIKKKN